LGAAKGSSALKKIGKKWKTFKGGLFDFNLKENKHMNLSKYSGQWG